MTLIRILGKVIMKVKWKYSCDQFFRDVEISASSYHNLLAPIKNNSIIMKNADIVNTIMII